MGRKLKSELNKSQNSIRKLLLDPIIAAKKPTKKLEHWLLTSWSLYMSDFKIYIQDDNGRITKLITSRKIKEGDVTNWFNIDNVENEIKECAKRNDLNIKGLPIILNDLKSTGYTYSTKDIDKAIQEAKKINEKNGTNIRIIE